MKQLCYRSLVCMLLIASLVGHAQTEVTEGPYTYEVSDGEATITRFDRECSGALSITNELGGCPVTSIGSYAFSECNELTNVTIPNSVASIESMAFSGCSGLTSVSIPNSVTSIGDLAFENSSGLTSVTIPASATTIGLRAFACKNLTNIVVEFANPAFSSVDGVFFNKAKTELIQYPRGRTGDYTIPDNVTTIGTNAFIWCSGLTSITISSGVTTIGFGAFHSCTNLTNVTIPDSVTSIDYSAFSECSGLTSMTIPASVTTISGLTFVGCTSLTNMTIPSSVTTISTAAFGYCTSLTNVTIPSSVTNIGDGTFSFCTSLTNITVESANLTFSSENGILFDKKKRTLKRYPEGKTGNYMIPATVSIIGYGAFAGCSGLTHVSVGASVTTIGEYAFASCSGLQHVTFTGKPPEIHRNAFEDTPATLYYLPAFAEFWPATFGGRPIQLWDPAITNTPLPRLRD